MNHYEILGLQKGAGEDEVKAAYRSLAQKYNPDNYEAGPLREDAEKKMNELNEAFDQVMSEIRLGPGAQAAQTQEPQQEPHQEPRYEQPRPSGEPRYEQPAQEPQQFDQQPPRQSGGYSSQQLRSMITQGRLDEALSILSSVPPESRDAEWNFLMGSAYYYKGWLTQALEFFQTACRMAPSNREYAAALHNLQSSANGQMPGNPYGNYGNAQANAVGCSCCDMCTAMMCMDMCCGCGGNGC